MVIKHADCPVCSRHIRIRTAGSDGVIGTFWKHRRRGTDDMSVWCEGGGDYPPALLNLGLEPGMGLPRERKRVPCLVCGREIMQMANGWLYRHYDGNGAVCDGGGTDPGQDGTGTGWNDNTTHTATGGTNLYWVPDDPLTITIAHPGGGAAGLELAEWWANTAATEIGMVVAKAIEYSATDLRDLGRLMAETMNMDPGAMDDEWFTELGIAFYAAGKVARIMGAIKERRRPSYDSWTDLGVYARMGQRVQQVGGWPGARND